jgi:hypothetical protein
LITVFTLAATPLQADKVYLATGEMLVGDILRMNNEEVSIQLAGGGIVSFRTAQVSRVRKTYREPKWDASAPDTVLTDEQTAEDHDAGRPVATPSPDFIPQAPSGKTRQVTLPLKPPPTNKGLVKDAEERFAVVPPKDFAPWPDGVSPTVPLSYREPVTHSSFTVSAYHSEASALEVKKNSLRAYTANFKTFTVVRNERLEGGGKDLVPETWLVEIASRVGGVSIHQLQVFTKNKDDVYVLTYSAAGNTYKRHSKFFMQSIQTFHFLQSSDEENVDGSVAPSPNAGG